MTDTPAAKGLTGTFLNIIRQQRHLGARVIISTQEPTISPSLIDLCSVVVIHRFTSPEWYQVMGRHIIIDAKHGKSGSPNGDEDGLSQISCLRTGEALVFAPSAYLLDESLSPIDVRRKTFKMMVRKRITWDGGRTIVTVR
jgi:DNA helicase HerA-like ATPase